jgi:hypothetical protein
LLGLQGRNIFAHALDLGLERAALGGRGAAKEQELLGVAADALRVGLGAFQLILLSARGVRETRRRIGVAGSHAGDLRL